MSDTNQDPGQQANPNLDRLREKADRSDQLEAENLALRRQIVFQGIDTSKGMGKMLFDQYQPGAGEEISREGLEAFAKTYDIDLAALTGTPVQDPQQQNQPNDPQNQPSPFAGDAPHFQVQDQATSGGGDPASESVAQSASPQTLVTKAFDQARGDGLPREQAQTAGIVALLDGAAAQNPRVLYDRQRWQAQNAPVTEG